MARTTGAPNNKLHDAVRAMEVLDRIPDHQVAALFDDTLERVQKRTAQLNEELNKDLFKL